MENNNTFGNMLDGLPFRVYRQTEHVNRKYLLVTIMGVKWSKKQGTIFTKGDNNYQIVNQLIKEKQISGNLIQEPII